MKPATGLLLPSVPSGSSSVPPVSSVASVPSVSSFLFDFVFDL